MSARKAWADLTPAYRARLERGGVSRETHERGAPILNAVGHGWHLPSRRARYERALARETARATASGNVSRETAIDTIEQIGPDRAAVIIDWQTERTDLGKGIGGPLTFQAYIEDLYGPDAWDDDWQEIYDELDDSWDYYHD
jgi:hypothetical protein